VFSEGAVPKSLGLDRAALEALGFEAKVGQAVVVPSGNGRVLVAAGLGKRRDADVAAVRKMAAAAARAAKKLRSLAVPAVDVGGASPEAVGQAVAEGIALGTYRFTRLKSKPETSDLEHVTVVADGERSAAVQSGIERGAATAAAVALARDLANSPPGHLTARDLADVAVSVAAESDLVVDVFDEEALADLGCGGLLGVNRGSVEPPRLVKLTYTPKSRSKAPVPTVALVGKGVTYDSGGISLKPSDASHIMMKMDMSGAAIVLAAMSVLAAAGAKVKVVGFMCCTDNMPSGSALKLGDVITIRNGTSVEIHNTDAEGRLVLADGLSLAVEEKPDAIVDIATLTGACQRALGLSIAGVMGNHDGWIGQVRDAAARTDEPVWPLPLPDVYRKEIDSNVADIKNIGGQYGGALIAGLFLKHFVGEVPWAHLDIAGTMNSDADEGWLSKGATAFGVRLLVDLLAAYQPVAADSVGAGGR